MPSPTFVVTTSQKADPPLKRVALEWAERLGVEFVPRRGRSITAICGAPRGAGGTPTSSNRPRLLLSEAISRSPCRT